MKKVSTALTPRGNSLAGPIPKDRLDATGLKPGDELYLTARDDGLIDETALNDAFAWSLGRYPQTYYDLAK